MAHGAIDTANGLSNDCFHFGTQLKYAPLNWDKLEILSKSTF